MGRLTKLFRVKRTTIKKIGGNKHKGKSLEACSGEETKDHTTVTLCNGTSAEELDTKKRPRAAKRVWFGENTLAPLWEENDDNAGVKALHNDDNIVSQVSVDQERHDQKKRTEETFNGILPGKSNVSHRPTPLSTKSILKQPKETHAEESVSKVTSNPTDYGHFLTKIVVNLPHLTDIVQEADSDDDSDCTGPMNIPNCTEDIGFIDHPSDSVFLTQGLEESASTGDTEVAGIESPVLGEDLSPTCMPIPEGNRKPQDSLVPPNRWQEIDEDCSFEPGQAFARNGSIRKVSNSNCSDQTRNLSSLSFKRKERERSVFVQTPSVIRRIAVSKETPQRNIFSHIGLPGKYSDVYKEKQKENQSSKQEELEPNHSELLSVQNSSNSVWDPLSSVYDDHPTQTPTTGIHTEPLVKKRSTRTDDLYSVSSACSRPSSSSSSMRSCRSGRSKPTSGYQIRPEEVLPQRTFFSCHENALKQAGHRMSDNERAVTTARKKKSRQLDDPVTQLQMESKVADQHVFNANVAGSVVGAVARLVSKSNSKKQNNKTKGIEPVETDEYEQRGLQVNPQRIVDYLKMVQKYPEEYKGIRKTSEEAVKIKPAISNLVRMGSAFSRFQTEAKNESLVVQAAYELGSKSTHPVCVKYEQAERQRQQAKAAAKDATESKVHVRGQSQLDESLTELERSRAEVELWVKTINMAQLVKARDLALRTLGEGTNGMRQWWVSHKNCRYIRANGDTPGAKVVTDE